MVRIINIFKQPFFTKKKYIISIWLILSIFSSVNKYLINNPSTNKLTYNNYNIFTGVYKHIIKEVNLYDEYPEEYLDSNHYGPFFSIIISLFALLPDWLGTVLWNIFNTVLLAFAIFKLPLKESHKVAISWIIFHELLTAQLSFQFNIGLVALILLSFKYLKIYDFWKASIAIIIGFLVKLYGIIGITFIIFIKENKYKLSFIIKFLIILIILLFLPITITSYDFLYQSYIDWFHSLLNKSEINQTISPMANISVLGFFDKCFGIKINVLGAVGFGSLILLIILIIKRNFFNYLKFQYFILCYLLFCLVLFNTNVESPTFIIAFVGVAIWFLMVEKNMWTISLFVFALLITSLSPSDLFPKFIREEFIKPYKLKVLPCIIIWIDLTIRLFITDFSSQKHQLSEQS